MKELSLHLGCSIRTVKRDIAIIQDFLPGEWKIEIAVRKGVILKKNPYAKNFQSNLLCFKNSFLFQTLKIIIEKNVKYIPHLADALYLSISSVYPILKDIDGHLDKYNITLQRNPLEIKGDEIQIILMYYELYQQAYSINEWPFNEYSKEFIYDWIQIIEKSLKIQFHITTKQKIAQLLSIFLKRKKFKKNIFMDCSVLKRIKQSRFYYEISKVSVELLIKCKIDLLAEDIAFLTIVVECSRYIYKDADKHIQEDIHIFRKENPVVFKQIQEFIIILENTFQIDLIRDDKLIFLITNYFKRTYYQLQCLSKIESPNELTVEYIKTKYPYTFQAVNNAYVGWGNQCVNITCIPKRMSNEDIAQITMHIEAAKLFMNSHSKKILLITEEGESWKQYIIAFLNNIFKNKLIFIDKFVTDVESETLKDIDLIIATMPLETKNYPVVYISTIPTNRDIDNLSSLI